MSRRTVERGRKRWGDELKDAEGQLVDAALREVRLSLVSAAKTLRQEAEAQGTSLAQRLSPITAWSGCDSAAQIATAARAPDTFAGSAKTRRTFPGPAGSGRRPPPDETSTPASESCNRYSLHETPIDAGALSSHESPAHASWTRRSGCGRARSSSRFA